MKSDRIAHLFADPGPFATAYVDASRDQEDGDDIADLQARAAADLLGAQGAPEEVVALVRERLEEHVGQPAPASRFLVATQQGLLLDELTLTHRPQPEASWHVLPDLGAWVAAEDTMVPFVLALVDHEGGDVRSYRTDPVVPDEDRSVGGETEYEHTIRGGGWSHRRYQHHVENVWRRNAAEVAAEIERQASRGADLVLLAGEPRSCAQVRDLVSADLRATVVQLESGGRSADGGAEALQAAINEAPWSQVVAAKLVEIRELRQRLGRDDSVAIGVGDVVVTRARTLGDAPSAASLRWNQPAEGTRA